MLNNRNFKRAKKVMGVYTPLPLIEFINLYSILNGKRKQAVVLSALYKFQDGYFENNKGDINQMCIEIAETFLSLYPKIDRTILKHIKTELNQQDISEKSISIIINHISQKNEKNQTS